MIEEYYRTNKESLERAVNTLLKEDKPNLFTWSQEIWTLNKGGIYKPVGKLTLPISLDFATDDEERAEDIHLFTIFSDKFFAGEPNYPKNYSIEESREENYGYRWSDWERARSPKIETIAEKFSYILGLKNHIVAYMNLRNQILLKRKPRPPKTRFDNEGMRCILSCFNQYD